MDYNLYGRRLWITTSARTKAEADEEFDAWIAEATKAGMAAAPLVDFTDESRNAERLRQPMTENSGKPTDEQ